MKFALIETKIALVKILKQFRIKRSANTQENLTFIEGIVRVPKKSIKVTFEKLN
jgi:cytochrome P450